MTRPPAPVPRERCVGLRERVDADGRVRVRPSKTEIGRVARAARDSGAESVAIWLLFSFLHPEHERAMSRAFRDLPTSVSHEVLAEFREFERSSTTALDAYVKPLVRRYLESLAGVVQGGFYVMKSSGGVVPHQAILRRPVEIVVSGPAGGVAAAVALARTTGPQNLLTFDMRGTSADFSTIVRGAASWTTEALIDTFPIALPILDIESVGAGGGSLAWLDTGRALRVGPQSAGADPGPMAYGKGGTSPTVTDADLFAGALGPSLLGGALPPRRDIPGQGAHPLRGAEGVCSHQNASAVSRGVPPTPGQ